LDRKSANLLTLFSKSPQVNSRIVSLCWNRPRPLPSISFTHNHLPCYQIKGYVASFGEMRNVYKFSIGKYKKVISETQI
jgi:hypothetical protein